MKAVQNVVWQQMMTQYFVLDVELGLKMHKLEFLELVK
jgi:hypothetical protein